MNPTVQCLMTAALCWSTFLNMFAHGIATVYSQFFCPSRDAMSKSVMLASTRIIMICLTIAVDVVSPTSSLVIHRSTLLALGQIEMIVEITECRTDKSYFPPCMTHFTPPKKLLQRPPCVLYPNALVWPGHGWLVWLAPN